MLGLIALVEIVVWVIKLRKTEKFSFIYTWKETWITMREDMLKFSLWHHLTNNLIKFIYQIDTVFLSYWATLTIVGNYSVAIQIASFSFILPSMLQNSTVLTLTRLDRVREQNRAVSLFIKYSFLLSIIQLIAYLLIGRLYIRLYTTSFIDEIYLYSSLIFVGTTILNIVRPLLGYITVKTNMKGFFVRSVVPSAVFAAVVYFLSSYLAGAVGIAMANILAYSFWVMTIIIYVSATPFRFKLILLDDRERKLFMEGLNKIRTILKI